MCILGGGFGGLYTALRLESLEWPHDKKPQVKSEFRTITVEKFLVTLACRSVGRCFRKYKVAGPILLLLRKRKEIEEPLHSLINRINLQLLIKKRSVCVCRDTFF